ncbi:SUF system NifU family Fe-S cluster assembly protein [Leptospira wolffii]|uniref:SUF system NifU family Fe-S cluster assembly protein n=1 Tax=Leptospira wolffii TaxID=409998 RepID=A0A2M9Z7K3_9LEPT|nr:SUF system NifU family Fe-S cluster assembly protein [Leptospira wolffii]PJZ64347.1 SUF system NifU family Fe-S cluster assembly protein [Leptospira wolffii]TGK58309.1 SUF system NifU family Fe-S cluster assembly protein [Leptospira wolffii]TGK66314.1 SUF system NifU family Fe-S cluster assembly protein [Leptospira wolffii]TGK68987.1 SUF system NifU family Fe-S cluster assembly protein [Leptospira wolffii]TGL27339.1 SUF system NifU family Fe-S cluster assembly protein [Leptospira wolffii]
MSLSDSLYKEVLIDHYQNPRHHGVLEHPDLHGEGVNPLCGDEVELFLKLDKDKIADITFTGKGCSISQASASMLTESLYGKTLEEAKELLSKFKAMLLEDKDPHFSEEYEDLESLEAVKKLPARIKCAVLAWNTLEKTLS